MENQGAETMCALPSGTRLELVSNPSDRIKTY